jgi:hypothetical protein
MDVRPLLKPGSADASYLIELIADGSMPPGTQRKLPAAELQVLRDWVDGGAPGYPKTFDEHYALDSIVSDAAKLPAGELTFCRYLSLAHLVNDEITSLQPRREALKNALREQSRADASVLQSIDPANSVYRVDLRRLGWEQQPFEFAAMKEGDKPKPAKLNLFDLILLEYPNGRNHASAQQFLAAAGQVLPVSFLEGDWLAEEFPKTLAGRELKRLFHPEATPAAAPPLQLPPTKFKKDEARERLLPFDAISRREFEPEPAPFRLQFFETQDAATRKPKAKFKLHDQFVVFVQANADLWVELVMTDPFGETDIAPPQRVEGNFPQPFKPNNAIGYEPVTPGTNVLTIYASKEQFPTAQVLRDKRFQKWLDAEGAKAPFTGGFVDRVVHKFYPAIDPEFDPAAVVKKTITIEVVK